MVQKHVAFAPFIPKASLSSPPERNHARSAFLTVFSPYSLYHAREEKMLTTHLYYLTFFRIVIKVLLIFLKAL